MGNEGFVNECSAAYEAGSWAAVAFDLLTGGGLVKGGLKGLKSAKTAVKEVAQVTRNRIAGNAARDELAELLRKEGREVLTEVYKKTPFGKRFIDIEVRYQGRVQGGIEVKKGSPRYLPIQQLKDWWLRNVEGYPVDLVRVP
jgi:hypothetical protein